MLALSRGPTTRAALVLALALAWLGGHVALDPSWTNVHGDGYYTYLWARSIVYDQDLEFAHDYELCGDPWGMLHMPHGDAVNQWNPGPSVFWIPILVWDRVTHHPALESGDVRFREACLGPLPDRAVRGSLVAGALTILLAYLAARRRFGEGAALAGTLVACLLSPLAYYATLLLAYGHAASACTSGVVVWLWDRERARPSRLGWVWLGLALGLAMLVRPQNGVLALLPFATWLSLARARIDARDRAGVGRLVLWGVAFVAAALVVFSPQLWYWWSRTGELFVVPQSEHYMRWGAPRLAQTLFSTEAGLFPWNPLLYTSFLGIAWLAWRRETRALGLPLLIVLVIHTYVASCVFDWWGGTSFPGRRFDSMVVPMALGSAAFFQALLGVQRARPGFLPTALTAGVLALGGLWTAGAESLAISGAPAFGEPGRADRLWTQAWERTSTPLWQAVGNPLAWPASLPFALRYGLHPRAWDAAGAPELFFHHWLTMEQSGFDWRFDTVERHAELLAGFAAEPEVIAGRRVRALAGEHARAVVPLGWPTLGGLRLDVAVDRADTDGVWLWLAIDGEDLGSHHVEPGPSALTVLTSGAEGHDGFAELRLRVVGGRLGIAGATLLDPTPTPAELQAERNRRTLARRRAWIAAHGGGV